MAARMRAVLTSWTKAVAALPMVLHASFSARHRVLLLRELEDLAGRLGAADDSATLELLFWFPVAARTDSDSSDVSLGDEGEKHVEGEAPLHAALANTAVGSLAAATDAIGAEKLRNVQLVINDVLASTAAETESVLAGKTLWEVLAACSRSAAAGERLKSVYKAALEERRLGVLIKRCAARVDGLSVTLTQHAGSAVIGNLPELQVRREGGMS